MAHALIDGDILIYRIGFACEKETENVAISELDKMIHGIAANAGCETFEIFLSGPDNFRTELAKTLPYKGNRHAPKPVHYQALRQFMTDHYEAVLSVNEEADDMLGWSSSKDTVICSIDKDLDMIPGIHYNFVRNIKYEIGELEGARNFFKQMLVGDIIDNIKGVQGIGKVKAGKLLDPCSSVEEMKCVVGLLYAIKEDEPEERMIENGKLLWIRRNPGQEWTLEDNECYRV